MAGPGSLCSRTSACWNVIGWASYTLVCLFFFWALAAVSSVHRLPWFVFFLLYYYYYYYLLFIIIYYYLLLLLLLLFLFFKKNVFHSHRSWWRASCRRLYGCSQSTRGRYEGGIWGQAQVMKKKNWSEDSTSALRMASEDRRSWHWKGRSWNWKTARNTLGTRGTVTRVAWEHVETDFAREWTLPFCPPARQWTLSADTVQDTKRLYLVHGWGGGYPLWNHLPLF